MMLQKNSLTVVGVLSRCWLFTYRTPIASAQHLLPQPLEPVIHNGYAFWNVVVSLVQHMRPRYFPSFVGITYWHIAYRLYVRLPLQNEKAIEGLYFLRSDCDNRFMAIAGNLMTDFCFHIANVQIQEQEALIDIRIDELEASAQVCLLKSDEPRLSPTSAFTSLEEAADFLKYKPNGISIQRNGAANVVRIARQEDLWRYRLMHVEKAHWSFFDSMDVQPEICYQIEPIAYQWNRGKLYRPLYQ